MKLQDNPFEDPFSPRKVDNLSQWSFDWRYFVYWPFDGLVQFQDKRKNDSKNKKKKKKKQKNFNDFLTQKN